MMKISQNMDANLPLEQQANQLLTELTQQLKTQGLWQADKPEASKLTSTVPFCCDTLAFEQWLQFVFISKLHSMLMTGMALPADIAIKPMAEESFKHLGEASSSLIQIIANIDQLLSAPR